MKRQEKSVLNIVLTLTATVVNYCPVVCVFLYVCVCARMCTCIHICACALCVRCTADRRRTWGVEPGELSPPGLWEHPVWPAGIQRSRPGDQRCKEYTKPHTHTQKFNPTHKHCTVNNTVLDVDDHYGPIHGCFLMLFCSFQAIQNPNDFMLQERAWNSVCPLVIKLKKFYSFSLRLGVATGLKYCLTFNIFQKWIIQVTGTFPLYAEVKVIMYST